MCLGSEQKKAQIILVCFLGAMVTMTERIRFGVVFAQRCRNQGGNPQTSLSRLEI